MMIDVNRFKISLSVLYGLTCGSRFGRRCGSRCGTRCYRICDNMMIYVNRLKIKL